MILFFHSIEDANSFSPDESEWEPVTMCPGHVTGSVLVMFRKAKKTAVVEPKIVSRKRRGRPPKIKYAIGE